jgi:transcriptional regulator with PAS, ATPase and Fis domain
VVAAETHVHSSDGSKRILEHHGDEMHEPSRSKVIWVDSTESRSAGVRYWPKPDSESIATLGVFELFLEALRTLRQAHAEREERMTLWPVDDPPIDGTHAVVNGEFRQLLEQAHRVAPTNVTVLIAGESGTGKEILARAIHQYSRRADKPFVPLNCAAVPRDLLESQLFGYRRGAFTGAERDSQGIIRSASEGTLFLDEIGELSLDLQPKLLRFLESGEIAPLGETSSTLVDVRIVAATNAKLDQLVQERRFRDDLFYRLNAIRLVIPPLRQRRDEIPELVRHFTTEAAREFGKRHVTVAEETMEHLLLYKWPGNIRQLQNELRAMVALAEPDSVLKPSALSPDVRRAVPRGMRGVSRSLTGAELTVQLTDKLAPTVARIEREMIQAALRAHPGRMDAAAKSLGISRKGLYLKRQRLGI